MDVLMLSVSGNAECGGVVSTGGLGVDLPKV